MIGLLGLLIILLFMPAFSKPRKCNQNPLKGILNPIVIVNEKDYKSILITPVAEVHLYYLPSGAPKMVILNMWDSMFWRDKNEEIRRAVYFWRIESIFPKPHYTFNKIELKSLRVQYPVFDKDGLYRAYVWVEDRHPGITPRISFMISVMDSGNRYYECRATLFPRQGSLFVK